MNRNRSKDQWWVSVLIGLMAVTCQLYGTAYAETIYKWVDENGKVHFGSRPNEHQEMVPVDIDYRRGGVSVSSKEQIKRYVQDQEKQLEEKASEKKREKRERDSELKSLRKKCDNWNQELRRVESFLSHSDNLLDHKKASQLRSTIRTECNF